MQVDERNLHRLSPRRNWTADTDCPFDCPVWLDLPGPVTFFWDPRDIDHPLAGREIADYRQQLEPGG